MLKVISAAILFAVLAGCAQTAVRLNERIKESGLGFRSDLGEHFAGLIGRDYQWRLAEESAELEARCAELGAGTDERSLPTCVTILAGTPNAISYDDNLLPLDPRKWWFPDDYINNEWRAFQSYRARFVKKSKDAEIYRDRMQAFLVRQYELLAEREKMGPVLPATVE